MIARYGIATLLGGLVALAVLFMMQGLIATARNRLDESEVRHFVNFVRVERTETLQRRERKPEKPIEPEAQPPAPLEPRVEAVVPGQVAVDVPAPTVTADLSIEGIGVAENEGEYLPIVKIAPAYPLMARTRRIEGYCIVEYTVTPAGTVRDVKVVEADPPGIFDRASIEAAMKFKYRPRVVNGEPIEVRGVRNIFRYKLEG